MMVSEKVSGTFEDSDHILGFHLLTKTRAVCTSQNTPNRHSMQVEMVYN